MVPPAGPALRKAFGSANAAADLAAGAYAIRRELELDLELRREDVVPLDRRLLDERAEPAS